MKALFTFAIALLVLNSAAASAVETVPNSQQIRWANWSDTEAAHAASECGHNDASKIGTFKTERFDAKSAARAIVSAQEKSAGCEKAQKISRSSAEAVTAFLDHVKNNEHTSGCFKGLSKYDQDQITGLVTSKSNLLVLSSTYRSDDSWKEDARNTAEACLFYNFYVFRKDGTLIKLTFNYTD